MFRDREGEEEDLELWKRRASNGSSVCFSLFRSYNRLFFTHRCNQLDGSCRSGNPRQTCNVLDLYERRRAPSGEEETEDDFEGEEDVERSLESGGFATEKVDSKGDEEGEDGVGKNG